MKRWEDEFALHTSGERLQMRGGSRMRSYMEEREMSMDGQITLKSLGIKHRPESLGFLLIMTKTGNRKKYDPTCIPHICHFFYTCKMFGE